MNRYNHDHPAVPLWPPGYHGLFYGLDGSPITLAEWAARFEEDRRVAFTELSDGVQVSTVWLGLGHGTLNGRPLIFETMVFPPDRSTPELDVERYCSVDEALRGHVTTVEHWQQHPWSGERT